jgi:hypothetical protein
MSIEDLILLGFIVILGIPGEDWEYLDTDTLKVRLIVQNWNN